MFFSIIVPTYNRATMLEKTLRSLLNQSFRNFEIIVVDDGSTDNTESLIHNIGDEHIRYYKKQNGGASAARNYGLQFAKGDFINFFDSDDIAYPNHLEAANKYIEGKPLARILIFDFEWGDLVSKNKKEVVIRFNDPNKAILRSNYPSTGCIFLHKDVFKELRFNESLSISEDWELWLKCSVRHEFHLGKVKTSCLVDHDERSVKKFSTEHLASQTKLLLSSLRNDMLFYDKNKSALKYIQAHMFSYIAIHAAVKANKTKTLGYFLRSLWLNPKSLFSKRSFAIIKHLSFSW